MKHSQLLRNMHESKEVFKQIMDTLQENGTVTTDFIRPGRNGEVLPAGLISQRRFQVRGDQTRNRGSLLVNLGIRM